MNALWNAPISDRFSSLCARVFSPAAAILESEKTLGTRLTGWVVFSLRASSPIWASEASLARTRERGRVLARPVSLTQTGELARRLQIVVFRYREISNTQPFSVSMRD